MGVLSPEIGNRKSEIALSPEIGTLRSRVLCRWADSRWLQQGDKGLLLRGHCGPGSMSYT
jgi:hypothetical protein